MNPATGKSQFTALMSPHQELKIGASEHVKIIKKFGECQNILLQNYVREVGAKVSANTERPDIKYKFYVLDTPMVNAFALPGGYIYISRGLLALANSEAEMAAVLAHETGHITGKHSAQRYSTGTLTSLGAGILSVALGSNGISQAIGLGSDLYLSSYSRGQENEADSLGMRYMTRAGYSSTAMPSFLSSLQKHSILENKIKGSEKVSDFSYFSTHPATSERINKTRAESLSYGKAGNIKHNHYLNMINGLIYDDSSRSGFIRGQNFYHTEMDFTFNVPDGFHIVNRQSQVIATSKSGSVIVFDMVGNKKSLDPLDYITNSWMKNEKLQSSERIIVNGMDAATASFSGHINNKPVTIRLVVVRWSNNRLARFQMAIPRNVSADLLEGLKRTSYSLRRLTSKEKESLRPYYVKIVTAKAGDTVSTLARQQPFNTLQEERFRVFNSLEAGEGIVFGQKYKLIF